MMEKNKLKIILFTNSFPYNFTNTETAFLKNEVEVLNRDANLTIIPYTVEGEMADINENIVVNNSLALFLKESKKYSLLKKIYYAFRYKYFYSEIIKCRSLIQIYNLILNSHQILTVYKWAKENEKLFRQNERTILYTYWNTNNLLGLAYYIELGKFKYKLISRAHGADLFLERNRFNPYYMLRLEKMDALFLASEAGRQYISKLFPFYKDKYNVAYLGTMNRDDRTTKKIRANIILVSCSTINEIKRVELIYKSVHMLAARIKNTDIKWTHLGGGPLELKLRQIIACDNLKNLSIEITGKITNEKVHEFYRQNFVDCFIHCSSTEGGIVMAIAEAQSYGIPVISTNVGGVSEIVQNDNGILVNPEGDPDEIAEAIERLVMDKKLRETFSINAYTNWREKFNAEKNYSKFLNVLTNL